MFGSLVIHLHFAAQPEVGVFWQFPIWYWQFRGCTLVDGRIPSH